MQSLTALAGGASSYEEAFNVVRRLKLDYADKNFSFLMDKQGTWSLAPAYDMVCISGPGCCVRLPFLLQVC